jgi:hypothetical protein
MDAFSEFSGGVPGIIAFIAAAVALSAMVRLLRSRRRQVARVVERPNSHYTSQAVRDGENRHRWAHINLDAIHEVNRDEVVRLLARLEVGGVDALRPVERMFLDQLAGEPESHPSERASTVEPHVTQEPHYRPA